MKRLMRYIGTAAFWLSWPVSFIYLRLHERTRLLILAEDKVLLVQTWHGPGNWSLPGGGIHKNEDIPLAATRELMEEVNIGVGVEQLKPLGVKKYAQHGLTFTCHYFVVELHQTLKIRPRLPEISDAIWAPQSELSQYKLAADVRDALSLYRGLVQ